LQGEVRKLMEIAPSSILATELEFLSTQRSQLLALDRFDSMNATCKCNCKEQLLVDRQTHAQSQTPLA